MILLVISNNYYTNDYNNYLIIIKCFMKFWNYLENEIIKYKMCWNIK